MLVGRQVAWARGPVRPPPLSPSPRPARRPDRSRRLTLASLKGSLHHRPNCQRRLACASRAGRPRSSPSRVIRHNRPGPSPRPSVFLILLVRRVGSSGSPPLRNFFRRPFPTGMVTAPRDPYVSPEYAGPGHLVRQGCGQSASEGGLPFLTGLRPQGLIPPSSCGSPLRRTFLLKRRSFACHRCC